MTDTPSDAPIDAHDAADLLTSVQAMVSFAHCGPYGPRVVNADVEAKLPDLHDPCPKDTAEADKVYWLDHLQRPIDLHMPDDIVDSGLTYTIDLVRGQLVRHVSFALRLAPPHRPSTNKTERFLTSTITRMLAPFAQQVFGPDDQVGWRLKPAKYVSGEPWLVYVHFTSAARIVTPMHLLIGRPLTELPHAD